MGAEASLELSVQERARLERERRDDFAMEEMMPFLNGACRRGDGGWVLKDATHIVNGKVYYGMPKCNVCGETYPFGVNRAHTTRSEGEVREEFEKLLRRPTTI